jgi:hypothetical protein
MNRVHMIVVGGLAAGLAGLVFGGWQFFVHPLSADYDAAVAQKADLETQLQTARDTAAQFDKFKAQAENMRRDLEFYSSRTDAVLNQTEVNEAFQGIGNELNLRDCAVTNPSPIAPANVGGGGGDLVVSKVEVRFKADYENMGTFINNCLNQLELVVPESITIAHLEDANGFYVDTVDVDLVMSVYGGKAKGKS